MSEVALTKEAAFTQYHTPLLELILIRSDFSGTFWTLIIHRYRSSFSQSLKTPVSEWRRKYTSVDWIVASSRGRCPCSGRRTPPRRTRYTWQCSIAEMPHSICRFPSRNSDSPPAASATCGTGGHRDRGDDHRCTGAGAWGAIVQGLYGCLNHGLSGLHGLHGFVGYTVANPRFRLFLVASDRKPRSGGSR